MVTETPCLNDHFRAARHPLYQKTAPLSNEFRNIIYNTHIYARTSLPRTEYSRQTLPAHSRPLSPARRFSSHCPHFPARLFLRPLPNSHRLSLCQHTQKECPKALPYVLYATAHRAVFPHLSGRIALSFLSEVTQSQRRRRLALALAHDAGDDQHDNGDEVRDHLDDLALRKGHADIVGHKVQHAEQYGA